MTEFKSNEIREVSSRVGFYSNSSEKGIFSIAVEKNNLILRKYDLIDDKPLLIEQIQLVYTDKSGRTVFHDPNNPGKYRIFSKPGMNDFLSMMDRYKSLDEASKKAITSDYLTECYGKYIYDHIEKLTNYEDESLKEISHSWVYISHNNENKPVLVTPTGFEYDPSLKTNFGFENIDNDGSSSYRFVNNTLVLEYSNLITSEDNSEESHRIDKNVNYKVYYKKVSLANSIDDEKYLKRYYEETSGR